VVPITGGALNPGPSIAAYADAKGAELLVVGSRGIGAVAGCNTESCCAAVRIIASFLHTRIGQLSNATHCLDFGDGVHAH